MCLDSERGASCLRLRVWPPPSSRASPAPLLLLRERLTLMSNTDSEVGQEPRGSGAARSRRGARLDRPISKKKKKKTQATKDKRWMFGRQQTNVWPNTKIHERSIGGTSEHPRSSTNVMQQRETDFCDGGETSGVPNMTVVSEDDKWWFKKTIPTFRGWQAGLTPPPLTRTGHQRPTTPALGRPGEFTQIFNHHRFLRLFFFWVSQSSVWKVLFCLRLSEAAPGVFSLNSQHRQLLIISSACMKGNVRWPRKPSQATNTDRQAKSNFSDSQSQRGPLTLALFSSSTFLCPVPNFKCTDLPPMGVLDPLPSRWKIQLTCSSSCLHYNSLP